MKSTANARDGFQNGEQIGDFSTRNDFEGGDYFHGIAFKPTKSNLTKMSWQQKLIAKLVSFVSGYCLNSTFLKCIQFCPTDNG